jgi:hypothetical protein
MPEGSSSLRGWCSRRINILDLPTEHFLANKRKITDEDLELLVESSLSVSEVLRRTGRTTTGSGHQHITRRIKALGISTDHFKGRPLYGAALKKKSAKDVLVKRSPTDRRTPRYQLERALLEAAVLPICIGCGITDSWNGKPIVLEIDHENGEPNDDRKKNLRFLCPNCHSQTPTHGYHGPKK